MPRKKKSASEKESDMISAMREVKKSFIEMRDYYGLMQRQIKRVSGKIDNMLDSVEESNKIQEERLKSVISTNENVEDTLMNVLAAIRQNEYLQAWYPAQCGFPEMKVTGSHPAKIAREGQQK
jgi:lysyl-tRNA synthetase class I